jgi:hypothetical protein
MAISATLLFGPRRERPFLGRKVVHEILSSIVAQTSLTIISVGSAEARSGTQAPQSWLF